MCGIFACIDQQGHALEKTIQGIKRLEYRGYDSWGIGYQLPDKLFAIEKHVGKIDQVGKRVEKSEIAIGHTRWATHGGITEANSHPHRDSHGRVFVVHNGMIENFLQIKSFLIQKGYQFESETDTEVFAKLIEEELLTKNFRLAVFSAFEQISGLNAFAVIDTQNNSLIALRRGSPLVVGKGMHSYYVASDQLALSGFADNVCYLEDGQGCEIKDGSVMVFQIHPFQETTVNWQVLAHTSQDLEIGKFTDFTSKEISEQHQVLANIVQMPTSMFKRYADQIKDHSYFIGCGSSYHASRHVLDG